MRNRRHSSYVLLAAAIISSVWSTSACAPKMVQVYPPSGLEDNTSINEVLEQLERGDKIRYKVTGGTLSDAVFVGQDTSSIYVKQYVWKKQIIGKKKVLSDVDTAMAMGDLEQLHARRKIGAAKKVASFVVGLGVLVWIVWAITPPPTE